MWERFILCMGRVSVADLKREDGQTTVEYAAILVGIVGLALLIGTALSGSVRTALTNVGNYIISQIPGTS